jgi:arginase family enzyme
MLSKIGDDSTQKNKSSVNNNHKLNEIKPVDKDCRSQNHSLIHVEPFGENELDISNFFTTKFDYVVKRNMYKPHKRSLAVYDLFRQIMVDTNKQIKTPILTLSPDPSISASTLAGAAEKFMYTESTKNSKNPVFKTNLKVIYIDSSPDVSINKYVEYNDFRNAVISDVIGINEESFSDHRVDIPPNHITFIGIDEKNLSDDQDGVLRKYDMHMKMFTSQLMKKKGINSVMENIINELMYEDVHVVIDLSCIKIQYAPSVIRDTNDESVGFDFDQMKLIVGWLKKLKRLNGVDITGYNFGEVKHKNKHHVSNILTVKTIEMIVTTFIELKQKSINLFNEDTKFLIWRKIDDTDSIGWYILRGVSLQDREQLINGIGDRIEVIPIPDSDFHSDNVTDDSLNNCFNALVTVTSMKEQQEKSYYTSETIYDCCLFPGEKLNMMFELLNTPAIQKAQSKDYEDVFSTQTSNLIKIDMIDDDCDDDCDDDDCDDDWDDSDDDSDDDNDYDEGWHRIDAILTQSTKAIL